MSFITNIETDQIIEKLSDSSILGLISPPGSGKSTTVVESIFNEGASIYIIEQTVTAVEGLYQREKKTLKNNVGFAADMKIKYKNDFLTKIRKSSTKLVENFSDMDKTPVVYMTDGHAEIILRDIIKYVLSLIKNKVKPNKINVSFCDILMVDEAHSSTLNIETIMALWKYLYNIGVRVPKLLLASATLNVNMTQFPNLQTHLIDIVSYPITIEYMKDEYPHLKKINSNELYEDLVNRDFLKSKEGDTWLVFCSGSNEVDKTCNLLKNKKDPHLVILPAYAEMNSEERDKIFSKTPKNMRKIVVSTNVAETSVTIDNLSGVFDTLAEKITKTSDSGGIKLELVPISKSSANQRKGRTGRTRSGFCFRMCSENYYNNLKEQRDSEIDRIPLYNLIIKILNLGLNPITLFPNIQESKVNDSLILLNRLKMLKNNKVTELGNFASDLTLSIKNTAILYKWISKDYDIFPCLSAICLINSYSNGYFYYPKKNPDETKNEYKDLMEDFYDLYFKDYEHESDIGVLLNLWFDFLDLNRDYENVNYGKILKFSNERKLNNKNFSNFITSIKQTTNILKNKYEFNVNLFSFDIDEFLEKFQPILREVYSDSILEKKGNKYIDEDNNTYYMSESKRNSTDNEIALLTFQTGNKNLVTLSVPN
mgnify:CR=1 FL=1